MKKSILIIATSLLFSCADEPKKVDPAFQKTMDSINIAIQCNECKIKQIESGVDTAYAEKYCNILYK